MNSVHQNKFLIFILIFIILLIMNDKSSLSCYILCQLIGGFYLLNSQDFLITLIS